ncbi:uncharacterized protein BO96DRAFT_325499 [Aspergillus niger CBS 101883]|uniref:Contig An08c0330, genomic contig n=3 Tax=Aspergillus niger TaxID=5061 RepID=A2QSV4_ASPNC|nr:uncharacterized protein BO96DRAFT_325499 [Aspergillus niger CBS 101883]XP_059601267.1 uncharacterized protein An08g12060 [Aspergillus niger]PYH61749.1 hypothetical protein BO96DRAFT_325499 [Aspergillus niger CBS 101883]RDH14185.1 hypothetical protein M747DRAFT_326955 [Aspergillus niger ATCC 13496]CAK40082.1 unnamed protein product [Aspergillus niger]
MLDLDEEYHTIMQSKIKEFTIGKDRKRFQIHMAVACLFPEEILRSPTHLEMDEIVFGRCCEFVYSGDYSVPLPNSSHSGSPVDQPGNSNGIFQEIELRLNPTNLTENIFHPTRASQPHAPYVERCDPVPWYEAGVPLNTDPAVDYSAVFLSHAEIVRFSSRTNWASLHDRSLYWLHYIVWNVEILMRDADFRQLLDRVPTLEKAVFRSMWKCASIVPVLHGLLKAMASRLVILAPQQSFPAGDCKVQWLSTDLGTHEQIKPSRRPAFRRGVSHYSMLLICIEISGQSSRGYSPHKRIIMRAIPSWQTPSGLILPCPKITYDLSHINLFPEDST